MTVPETAAEMNTWLMRPLSLPAGFFPDTPGALVTADGRRLTADDRLDLMAIVNRVDWSLLAGAHDELMALMTDDVEFDHGFGYARGKPDVLPLIRKVPSMGLRHHFTNHTVFIADDGQPGLAAYMLVTQLAAQPPVDVRLPAILDQNVFVAHFRAEGTTWRMRRLVFDQAKLSPHIGAPDAIVVAMGLRAAERAASRRFEPVAG